VKGELVNMTEDIGQKERRLVKELAKVRAEKMSNDNQVRPSRDYSLGGLPPDTTHKSKVGSADTPDAIQLPIKKRPRTENKW
jgi:hypothetical protein